MLHTSTHEATDGYVIMQDNDLEYDPKEYNSLLRPVVRGAADVIYG